MTDFQGVDVPHTTCTADGCDKVRKARGLCSTHYNRTLPTRHRKIMVACEGCGAPCAKENRAPRYAGTYCSELCRDYVRWGSSKCDLPSTHWARIYGATCQWTPPVVLRQIMCDWCGQPRPTRRNDTLYCTTACKKRVKRMRRRGAEHSALGQYRYTDIVRLWRSFGAACAYCMEPTPLVDIQAEHVHPLSRGGRNDVGNLLPSCMPCNADKRDLLLTEWATDRARRGLEPRVTSWAVSDTRYAHLVTPTDPLATVA